MVYSIEKAILEDIPDIEIMAKLCFEKFDSTQFYQSYDSESYKKSLEFYISNENLDLFVCKEKNKIVGFLNVALIPQSTNENKKQLVDLAMQPDPRLTEIEQAKILIKLIDFHEKHAKKRGAHVCAIVLSGKFDIGKNLMRKGYKLGDRTYIKEVV